MVNDPKTDKLAKVREVGEMIRSVLAENMKARIGDVVEEDVLDETQCVLAAVLKLYLEQVLPGVKVTGHASILPDVKHAETIEFALMVRGELVVSISPGAEDDTLPDPEHAVDEKPPKT